MTEWIADWLFAGESQQLHNRSGQLKFYHKRGIMIRRIELRYSVLYCSGKVGVIMKLFHLSDLHIGLKLVNRDLYEDQKFIFNQIADYAKAEQPDAILIAGDIYDKSIPSAEAVELFDWFIMRLTEAVPHAAIMMVSGNHDSAQRVNCYRGILAKQNVYMIGLPPENATESIEKIVLTDAYGDVNFYLLPFVKPSMVKQIVGTDEKDNLLSYHDTVERLLAREQIDTAQRNVIVSHQFYLPKGSSTDTIARMDSEIVTVGNIDAVYSNVLEAFDYAALGHIHKPMCAGTEYMRYCGTPLACSVSEAGQQKGILSVTLGAKGERTVQVLPLTPMRQVRLLEGNLDEILQMASDDYVSILLTDDVDLDIVDMQDRIRAAFPNVLEIRRAVQRKANYTRTTAAEQNLSPFALCCAFLKDLDDTEKEILQDVILTVQGVK